MHLQQRVVVCVCVYRTAKPPLGTPHKIGQGCTFHSFTTNTYKMHFLESPSGIKVSSRGIALSL